MNDTADKRGFTLTELMAVTVIYGFIILIIMAQFFTQVKFYNMIIDQSEATTDASIAMHSMERVLMYGKSSAAVTINDDDNYHKGITVTIPAGYLDEITADATVTFGRKNDTTNTFQYVVGGGTPYIISKNITEFTPSNWDPATKELTLQITATKNTRSSSLESKVRLLGG